MLLGKIIKNQINFYAFGKDINLCTTPTAVRQ